MRISADLNRCVGAGQCVLTDPSLFDQNDEDGTVVLLADVASGDQTATAHEAVGLCPSGALSLVEERA
jgi:ferredoxin